jgi:hypothetical protein
VKDRVGPQQEKGIWLTLVDHLQRQDKLPVVAFTLSRNRCDQVSVVPSEFFCGISLSLYSRRRMWCHEHPECEPGFEDKQSRALLFSNRCRYLT